jgi:hypothetical protein
MIAMIAFASLDAHGMDCVRTVLPAKELPRNEATAIAVRDLVGTIEFVPTAGDVVQVDAQSCGAEVRLQRRGGIPTLVSRRDAGGDLVVRVQVPAGVQSVSLLGVRGDVGVRDLPVRVAVISSEGSVSATDVAGLRVAYHRGDVHAVRVATDVVVDHLDGELSVDEVPTNEVTDPVQATGRTSASP